MIHYYDTLLWRYTVLTILKTLDRFRERCSSVLVFPGPLCIKSGPLIYLPEASAMRYVAEHTSVPVPKVYSAFVYKNCTYILMQKIKGDTIGRRWVGRPLESKARLLTQLSKMVNELRRLPAPEHGVSNVDVGPFYEGGSPYGNLHWAFKTTEEFHTHLRQGLKESHPTSPEINKFFELHKRSWDPIVLTHGDLSSLNILVQGENIVGIVDWETAGWFPSYSEYTTAHQVNTLNLFWREEVDRLLGPNLETLVIGHIRQKYFGVISCPH